MHADANHGAGTNEGKHMAKAKTAYVCTECGAEHSKWQGQCVACGLWNTLSAIVLTPASAAVTSVEVAADL